MRWMLRGWVLLLPWVVLTPVQGSPGFSLGVESRVISMPGSSWEPTVVVDGDRLVVAWLDFIDASDAEVFSVRSLDRGITWEPVRRLTDNATQENSPWLIGSGSELYLAYSAQRPEYGGSREIHFQVSHDGGASWSGDRRISHTQGESRTPRLLLAPGGTLHLAWMDDSQIYFQIYHSRSTDGGASWSAAVPAGRPDEGVDQESARMVVNQLGELLLVTRDARGGYPAGGNPPYDIYRSRSTDGGASWIYPALALSPARPTEWTDSYDPSAFVDSSGAVHVTWWSDGWGSNAYHRRSTDGGYTWGPIHQLSTFGENHPGYENWGWGYPGLVERVPGELWCVYFSHWTRGVELRQRYGDLYLVGSTDGGASWGASRSITTSGRARNPRLSRLSAEQLLVIWQDERDNNPPEHETWGDDLFMRTIDFGVREDHHPRILSAGWWETDLTAQGGGDLAFVVLVDDPDGLEDIQRVELALDGEPLGIELARTDAGTGLGEGVYSFMADVAPDSVGVGQYAIEIEVEDSQGYMARWPHLEIFDAQDQAPYIPEIWQPSLPNPIDRHAPDILLAGYWDTHLTEEQGGVLTLAAMVRDIDGDWDLDRVELTYMGVGTGILLNDDGPAGGVGDTLPGDNLFMWRTGIGPGLLDGLAGTYALTLVASDIWGDASEWPYLSVRPGP